VSIKGEYAVRGGGAITTDQRGRMRTACAKRVIVRGMARTECEEKPKEEEYLDRREVGEVSL
jgi:hypothetical protein